MISLTGCTKTVQWEEEVLLNTGETIWVSKIVNYSIQGRPGNPADIGYSPEQVETLSFKYGGRSYMYKGDASQIMVLAISPQKTPVLLAPALSRGWSSRNNYKCTKPYYVQLIPDASGLVWTWPEAIEPWTYNLPTNLMLNRKHPSEMNKRYTMEDKSKQDFWNDRQLLDIQKINPLKEPFNCVKKESNKS